MTAVHVFEMYQHFLYLPFYYAQHRGFYGYIKGDYNVELQSAFPSTDEGALLEVLASPSGDAIRFAICDPSPLLDASIDDDDPPAVLASIITNAAIWAIDKDAEPVRTFDELKNFKTIISFRQGTTTYGMARRIVGASDSHRIKDVGPGEELNALAGEPNAIALSPEILMVVSGIKNRQKLKIILPLGATREYDNVLVTALVTRKSVVDEHPALVDGMLAALQRAMIDVSLQSDDVRNFAAERFGRDPELISMALEAAADAAVFPPNILVQPHHWEAAASAYREGQGRGFDAETRNRAYKLYEKIAHRYAPRVKAAMQMVVAGETRQYGGDGVDHRSIGFAAFGLFAGVAVVALVTFATGAFSPLITGIAGIFGTLGVLTAMLKSARLSKLKLVLHAGAYVVGAGFALAYFRTTSTIWQGVELTAAIAVFGMDAGLVRGWLFGEAEK